MQCDKLHDQMIDFVTGNLDDGEGAELLHHTRSCPTCRENLQAIEGVWRVMGYSGEKAVPQSLREQTLALVYEENLQATVGAERTVTRAARPWLNLAATLAVGVSVTAILSYLISLRMTLSLLSPLQLLIGGAVWGVLISAACYTIMGHAPWQSGNFRKIIALCFAAIILAVVFALLCSDKTVYDFWENNILGATILSTWGRPGSFFIFGLLYALLPLFAISALFGFRLEGSKFKDGLCMGAAFYVLLFPAIYLQCEALLVHSADILSSWALGSLAGALFGALIGLQLTPWLHLPERLVCRLGI